MASSVRILVISEEKTIKLPQISLRAAWALGRVALWNNGRLARKNPELNHILMENKNEIQEIVKTAIKIVRDHEPFTLVEVQSTDSYVLIQIV